MPDSRFRMAYLDWQKEYEQSAAMLYQAFARMEDDGTVSSTFYDGSVRTAEDFVQHLCRPGAMPFLLFWENAPAGVTWLNGVEGRTARGHFCLYRSVWGRRTTATLGRCIFETMLGYRDADGFMFDTILGLTPISQSLAWRLSMLCGAEKVGVLPNGAFIKARGTTEDAVLTAATRGSLAKGK